MSQDINDQQYVLTSKADENEAQSVKEEFKLPKLVPPQSRGRIPSRKQNKAPSFLPRISDQQDELHNFRKTQLIRVNKQQNNPNTQTEIVRDDFALEVEQKLKKIMDHQQNKSQQIQNEHRYQNEDAEADDFDFQQKINQNKQIIKLHRQKNQTIQKKNQSVRPGQLVQKLNNKSKTKTLKPQSNYEKKMNNYNESLQNKFLQRKKQSLGIISEKAPKPLQRAKSKKTVSMKDALDEAKVNYAYKQFKSNGQINKTQNKETSRHSNVASSAKGIQNQQFSKNVLKNQSKASRKTQENSPSRKTNKTDSLFDNIQSFLQNPTAVSKHEKFYKQLVKKLQNKDINKLQEQIKEINQKMGVNQNYETQSTVRKQETDRPFLMTESPLERTVRDWKRMEIKSRHNLHYQDSNFQKQLDYISYLQQKNSSSLSKFIDHQKIMVQLQINKRFSRSIAHDIKSEIKSEVNH